jgi:hypothetical protein
MRLELLHKIIVNASGKITDEYLRLMGRYKKFIISFILILLSVFSVKCDKQIISKENKCDVPCGPNAECVNGGCKCIGGYSDCNNNMNDGCETNI